MAKNKVSTITSVHDLLKQIEHAESILVNASAPRAENLIVAADKRIQAILASTNQLRQQRTLLLGLNTQDVPKEILESAARLTAFALKSADQVSITTLADMNEVARSAYQIPVGEVTTSQVVEKRKSVMEVRKPKRSKKKVKSSRKKSKSQFGIYAPTGKMLVQAFANSPYPETLEGMMELVYGPAWKNHKFGGYLPGHSGPLSAKLGTANGREMFKLAIANGYKALAKCEKDYQNATSHLKKVFDAIKPVNTVSGVKIVLHSKWGIEVE